MILFYLFQFANDEGDPGMGLELGLDAFSYGGTVCLFEIHANKNILFYLYFMLYNLGEALHGTVRHLLCVAYELLDRDAFATILQVNIFLYLSFEQI
jgi:hypothetical protein